LQLTPVSSMEPFLVVNFIICLNGAFPSHSMDETEAGNEEA